MPYPDPPCSVLNRLRTLAAPVALLLSAGAAHAADVPGAHAIPRGFVNAADLRDWCLSASPTLASSCFAYVAGVHDSVRAYEAWLGVSEYCAPADVTQSDLRDAFLAYMRAAPEHAFGEAASVVVVALKQAFACPVRLPGK